MKKIVHIITGLGSGGAENMLYKLLKQSNTSKYYHEVISLLDYGVYGPKIEELGIKVHVLNLNKFNLLSNLIKARIICKNFDVVNTWLYHADIFGFFVSKVLLNKKLIWNIRHSNLENSANKPRTLKIIKFNSKLSNYVDYITYNSYKAQTSHENIGYNDCRKVVIPNGFELDKFKFNENIRKKVRENLGIHENEKVIITVGRWDIQKDYYTLLKALNQIDQQIKYKMIFVGTNLDISNKKLMELITSYNLKDKIILLGRRSDIPDLLSGADIYVSSSLGESFSNSIGEAMACELSCVVTDVGDSKIIVGDTGEIVPARNYKELARALTKQLNAPSIVLKEKGLKARQRIIENYDLKKVTKKYENIFDLVYSVV